MVNGRCGVKIGYSAALRSESLIVVLAVKNSHVTGTDLYNWLSCQEFYWSSQTGQYDIGECVVRLVKYSVQLDIPSCFP